MPVLAPAQSRHAQSRRGIRSALWALVALAALIGAAHLSLRYILGLGNPVLVTPDAACGYITKPNQNDYRFFNHIRVNSYGMRSASFTPTPASGTLRIMFVGDSVAYGTTRVDQSRIFTEIVRRDLPSVVHQPVEVLNASANAWAIDNELSYVRSRGIFHSNIVLLVLNSGDPSQPRATISGLGGDSTVDPPSSALGEIWDRMIEPRFHRLAAHTDAGDTANSEETRVIQENLADLDQFRNLVTAQHARFAIVYLPFRREIPQPAARAQTLLHTWAAAHHVPLLDLTSVEAEYPTRAITLDGDHFNARGNQIVARAIEARWLSTFGS